MNVRAAASIVNNEFRRGWPIVLASFVGLALGMMPLAGVYSIGVLAGPLTAEFGWSRGDVMLVPTMLYVGLIPSSFIVGWVADRFGVRRITMFSLLALSLAFVALGTLTNGGLWAFLAIYLFMGFFGEAAGPITYSRSIIGWFSKRRGLALGMMMAGTGVSALVIPAYTNWLVEGHGWRGAYIGLAALPALITLPVVFFLLKEVPHLSARRAGKVVGNLPGLTFRQAISGYRFWLMVLIFSGLTAIVVGLITNLVPMLTDGGYSTEQAVLMASTWGIATLCGRLLIGFLLDHFWAPKIAIFVFVPAAVACLTLMNLEWGWWSTILAISLVGALNGAEFDLLIYMMTRYFGQLNYGLLFALMYVLYNIFASMGPAVFGYTFDFTGNYDLVLIGSSVMLVVCSVLMFALGRYPQRFPNEAPVS